MSPPVLGWGAGWMRTASNVPCISMKNEPSIQNRFSFKIGEFLSADVKKLFSLPVLTSLTFLFSGQT